MELSQHVKALGFFLKAEKINEKLNVPGESLFYNIGVCFNSIDFLNKAFLYFSLAEKNPNERRDKSAGFDFRLDTMLALLYNKIGEYSRAERLLFGCLNYVNQNNNKTNLGIVFHNLACVYSKIRDYEKASEYFSKAEKNFETNSIYYMLNLLYKAYSMLDFGKTSEAKEIAELGMGILCEDSDMFFLFKSVKCSLNLSKDGSEEYIANITIPRLLAECSFMKAIEYCDLLGAYYQKKKNYVMALRFKDMSSKYSNKILKGDLDI
ncbi:hypothetical protein FACS189490_05250 [Clostridia bacterium]|nr:hypothetical protein FACS189490_05250 [Clostridia bacterium]